MKSAISAVTEKVQSILNRYTLPVSQKQEVIASLTEPRELGGLATMRAQIVDAFKMAHPGEHTAVISALRAEYGLPATTRSLAVDPQNTSGWESRKEFYEQDEREQRAKDPVVIAQKKFNEVGTRLATMVNDLAKKFWSQDLETLAEVTSHKEVFETVGAVDEFGLPEDEGKSDLIAAGRAATNFLDSLPSRGITLSKSGRLRYMCYVVTQVLALGVQINEQTMQAMLDRLTYFNCFADGEMTVAEEPEPEPEPELTEKQIVEKQFYGEHVSPLHFAWLKSLQDVHQWRPSEEVLRYLYGTDNTSRNPQDHGWFFRTNTPYSYAGYNAARRHLVHVGMAPRRCLTQDEVLAAAVENADLGNYEERRTLSRRLFGGDGSGTIPTINTPDRPYPRSR
jgi:hypothetical protein